MWAEALYHGLDALLLHHLGRDDEADAEAAAGIAAADETGSRVSVLWCYGVAAHVALDRGQLADAEQLILDGESLFSTGLAAMGFDLVVVARSRWHVARGEHAQALAGLSTWWSTFEALGVTVSQERLALDLAVAAKHQGADDVARRVSATVDDWAAQTDEPRIQLFATAVSAVAVGDVATLVSLTNTWGQHGSAVTARHFAELFGPSPRSSTVSGLITELPPFVARGALAPPGARSFTGETVGETVPSHLAAWYLLTPAEQRVCLSVVQGQSNKAIAADLYLSLRTVETHVSRILRKLGVSSRLQLALLVRGPSSVPARSQ